MTDEEPKRIGRHGAYWLGLATGVLLFAILVLLLLAIWIMPSIERLFTDIHPTELPRVTRVVINDAFGWGLPALFGVLTIAVQVGKPGTRRILFAILLALVAIGLVVMTVWAYYLPLYPLS